MTDTEYRTAARKLYQCEGAIEIDDTAPISRGGDGGAYVQAWVWVRDDDEE